MAAQGASLAETLDGISWEADRACDLIMTQVMSALALVEQAKVGELEALSGLGDHLTEIMSACAFQDLIGQRISQAKLAASGVEICGDDLLNGPTSNRGGLSQRASDQILAELDAEGWKAS